jgi:EthD domain
VLAIRPFCDAVGELWFESAEAVPQALQSQEFAAVVEDGQNFINFETMGMVMVNEKDLSAA